MSCWFIFWVIQEMYVTSFKAFTEILASMLTVLAKIVPTGSSFL